MRKITLITILTFGIVGVLIPHSASAIDDNPCGSLYDHKVENLSGKTFTVPTPPDGWTVEFAVVKVGGPGGGTHITFDPASAGQVLDVSNQQYDISHVHVCKSQGGTTSTSTSTTSTTTTTVAVTTVPESSSTTTTVDAPTTTVSESTSTSSPSTSSPDTTSSTVPVITTTDPSPSSTNPAPTTTVSGPTTSTPSPKIPATGTDNGLLSVLAASLVIVGWLLVRFVRRAA